VADIQVNAEIVFDANHSLQTRSTPEQIENQIQGSTNPQIPLIPVELPNGESVMVNAAQIRVIKSARSPNPEDYRVEQM
jgi:hypothetical protein